MPYRAIIDMLFQNNLSNSFCMHNVVIVNGHAFFGIDILPMLATFLTVAKHVLVVERLVVWLLLRLLNSLTCKAILWLYDLLLNLSQFAGFRIDCRQFEFHFYIWFITQLILCITSRFVKCHQVHLCLQFLKVSIHLTQCFIFEAKILTINNL